jgi:hypothetical protein
VRAVAALWLAAGCHGESSPAAVDIEQTPTAAEPAIDWAAHVGQPPPTLAKPPSAAEAPVSVQPPIMADPAYDSDEIVPARHLVYRVSFVVPPALRGRREAMLPPSGELHIDVSADRLRARFLGPGWPLEEGTELRLRSDMPGTYLFDGKGGRSLGPGQLASWFQGHEAGRARTYVYIRREPGLHDSGPGDLLCALLAEWSGQPREDLAPRCQGAAMPPGFRIGLWTAELTAIVPIKSPRRKLRADAGDPPEAVAYMPGRPMLDPGELVHLAPLRVRVDKLDPERTRPVDPNQPGIVQVDNRADARVVVVVQGVPVGWVAEHERVSLEGFTPGHYRVGAVRPLGQPAMTPTLLRIPGALRFGKAEPRTR